MSRFITFLFLITYAWSNLAGAVEALAYPGESVHIAHEIHHMEHDAPAAQEENRAHNPDQDHDQQHEDQAHHHCAHNLVGMAFTLPTSHQVNTRTLLTAIPEDPYSFELKQRLLRPPRH